MLRRKCAVLVGLVVVVWATGLHGIAQAATVTCGQVITQDTTLDADVGPCPGNGIIIGANNITLDLNGHTVFGSASASTPNAAVSVNRFSGIRIRNGTVTGFSTGVAVNRSPQTTLHRLVVRDNRCDGIVFAGAQGPPQLLTSLGAVLENSVRGNGCAGILLAGRVLTINVERNAITDNGGPGITLGSFGPINTSVGITARGNSIVGNRGDGVFVAPFSLGTTIAGNVIRLNGGNGVHIQSSLAPTGVEENRILGNALNGVLVVQPGSAGVLKNVALGNGVGTAVPGATPAYDLADRNPGCGGNTWSGNQFLTRNQPCIN